MLCFSKKERKCGKNVCYKCNFQNCYLLEARKRLISFTTNRLWAVEILKISFLYRGRNSSDIPRFEPEIWFDLIWIWCDLNFKGSRNDMIWIGSDMSWIEMVRSGLCLIFFTITFVTHRFRILEYGQTYCGYP